MSRQEGGTGKKLPPTPTKPSNVVINRKLASLPATPSRQLPKTRTPSEESYYKSDYNEDYNYAYRSQDNLPQDTYTENIYSQQQTQNSYGQQSTQVNQVHVANKTHYPEINQDNQYGYATVDGQYDQSYPEQQTQNSYGETTYAQQNSYKDEYQQPYAQQNAETYHESYLDTTYPIASQANDHQYTNQTKNQYDKPDGMIIEDNYHEMGFSENNIQYHQQDYKQQDVYQEQYDDYNVTTVPSSVYDQNNVTNTYNQYQPPEQYDSQYNINTSTDYQKTYQETYNQVPVTSQENYQESYTKQPQEDFVNYQTPYSKQEDVPTTYKNNYQESYQENYQEIYDEYQDSYQGSFEEQRYKESPRETTTTTDRRQSEVPELSVTTPRGQTRTNGYPSSESEYIYQENEDVSPLSTSRRKKLGNKRVASPLLQQNTDSLESRDDELKDSFETAVSSVSSNQLKKGYSEYSTAGDSSPAAVTLVDSSPNVVQSQTTTMVNHVTANHVTTTAMVHNTTNIVNGKRPLARTDSYQEDIVDDEEYPEIIPKEPQRKDSQLSHQSQLSQHSQSATQKPKLTRGDSYASDNFPEESYSRRESYSQLPRKDSFSSTTEGFKPPLTRTDSYQQRELRGSNYGQNFNALQPISRAESYQRGHFKDQESIDQSDIVLSNTINGDYQMRDETLERYKIQL